MPTSSCSRELIYHADWPAYAAKRLSVPDWYNLFPSEFAHRLKRRESVAKLEINKPVEAFAEAEMSLMELT
mgnify:CR=1 FL=1